MELRRSLVDVSTLERARLSREDGRLVGSRCEACGAACWPSRAFCHGCGAPEMREVLLDTGGTLVTYTTVWVPRPGVEAPYTIGEVVLSDGVRLFAHVRGLADGTTVPAQVRLAIAPTDDAVPAFWFEPAAGQGAVPRPR